MIDAINGLSSGWWAWIAPLSAQVAVLGTFAWLVDMLLKKRGWPQVRYALWLVVFAKLLLPPGFALPTSIPGALLTATPAPQALVISSSPAPLEAASIPVAAEAVESPPTAASRAAASVEKTSPTLSLESWAMLLWAGGVAVLCVWLVRKLGSLRRLLGASRSAKSEWVEDLLADCAGRLALKRLPRVVITDKVKSPAVFGILRSVILFPEGSLDQSSRLETEHVLLHELAHIKRRDTLVNAAQTLLHIAFWFHPLVWLAGRRSRDLRELCCDATVAGVLGDQTPRYRATLIETARGVIQANSPLGIGLLGLLENQSSLKARLLHLSRPLWKHRKLKYAAAAAAAVAMTLLIVPMARPQASSDEEVTVTAQVLRDKGPRENRFRAVLDGGVEVEVVGVSFHPSEYGPWWRPDGTRLAEAPYDNSLGRIHTSSSDEQPRQFAVRLTAKRAGDVGFQWRVIPSSGAKAGWSPSKNGTQVQDMKAFAASVPLGNESLTLQIGVAAGPWETRHSAQSGASMAIGSQEGSAAFSPPVQAAGNVSITVSDDFGGNFDRRVVAVSSNGDVRAPTRTQGLGAGGFYQTTSTFNEITLGEISQFQLQTRGYEWVQFDNIAVHPLPHELPELRYLAWQIRDSDEYSHPWDASGTTVRDESVLPFIQNVHPPRVDSRFGRTLCIWFSHPLFIAGNLDGDSLVGFRLLRRSGEVIKSAGRAAIIISAPAVIKNHADMGWIAFALPSGPEQELPDKADIELQYVLGNWHKSTRIKSDGFDQWDAERFSHVTDIGHDADGRAFISLAQDFTNRGDMQFAFTATTKHGQRLTPEKTAVDDEQLRMERFNFNSPLSEIAHFQLLARPIRTATFRDVSLRPTASITSTGSTSQP